MMRRAGICEERWTGWDKVVSVTEIHQLPAPLIETPESNTRVVLFGPKRLNDMDKRERLRAVYQHACLRYVMRENLTNTSLRERFGVEQKNSAVVSRMISDAVEAGYITPFDPKAGKRFMRYVPYWANAADSTSL